VKFTFVTSESVKHFPGMTVKSIYFSPKPIVIARPFYFTVSAVCRNKSTKSGCPFGNIPIFIGKVTDPTNASAI